MQQCYIGPYLITREILPANFVLQKSLRSAPFVAHWDKVKQCYAETPASSVEKRQMQDAPDLPTPTTQASPGETGTVPDGTVQLKVAS